MKRKLIFIIIITAVLLSGCKSLFTPEGNLLSDAKKAEKQSNYHAAVLNVFESIQIDNEYKKAIEFLKEVYPKANSFYALKIDQVRAAGGASVNDDVAMYYKFLHAINEAARTMPNVIDPSTKLTLTLTYTDYKAELNMANEAAAEEHYQKGTEQIKLKGRENSKSAAEEFEKALSYVPGYKNAEAMIQKALNQATQILAFFPFTNNAWNIPTAQFADIMQGAIISSLMSDQGVMKYTKIIDQSLQDRIIEEQVGSLSALMDDESRVEIGQLLNSNIFITGTIDSAILEGPNTTMNQHHRSADIEVEPAADPYDKDNTSTDADPYAKDDALSGNSSDVDAYGTTTVEADIFLYRKSITFDVTISYKAVDVESGTILNSNTIHVTAEDSSEWAEWRGDEEALTWEDQQLIDAYEESVKSAQQIASEAAEQAGSEIASGLTSFLK
ncbi:MAG TPA: hypothetical protein DCO79_12320 [Spirochaeta sp.]|nr:hypothetical protein [Spirochaeta sp.]